MMRLAAAKLSLSRQELVRWSTCAAIVCALHGIFALTVLASSDDENLESGTPIVMVDLAPIAVATPGSREDIAPGPQVQPDSQQQLEQKEKSKIKQVERVPDEAPQPNQTIPLEQPKSPEQPTEEKNQQRAQEASVAAAPPTATVTAALPAAPAPGEVARPNPAVIVSWQRKLIAHLERFKRYPSEARAEGVTNIAFQIDRQGRILSSRILHSSGSLVLDQEALAMIKRAEPLPAPPDDILDTQLSFTIPIRYASFGQR
jgi:periplasmic protein TonB